MTAQLIALLALPTIMGQAQADVIVIADPFAQVTSSTEISTCCADRDPADLANGSGLVGGLHDVNPGNMWLSNGSGFGGVDLDPWVLSDPGAEYTISSFHVWNYNEAGAFATRGVNSVSVEYGTTPALGSTVPGIANFASATGAGGDPGENFSGFAPFTARYIKIDINTNHGDGNVFYGLSEVQFEVLVDADEIGSANV